MAKRIMSKYDYQFTSDCYRKIPEFSYTTPGLVLSMADIYRKYAATGDISQLPGKVRPVTFDNGSEFDESFESEEMTDTMLHASQVRARALADRHRSVSADKQSDAGVKEPEEGSDPIKDKPSDVPSDVPPVESDKDPVSKS